MTGRVQTESVLEMKKKTFLQLFFSSVFVAVYICHSNRYGIGSSLRFCLPPHFPISDSISHAFFPQIALSSAVGARERFTKSPFHFYIKGIVTWVGGISKFPPFA